MGTEEAGSSSAGEGTNGPHRSHNSVGRTGGSLGQGGPIDPWVVEGTAVLIAAVALHHKVSANRAV